MAQYSCGQRIGAEFIGSAFLLATVIGSGIMGERLAGGNEAIALLGNTLPTGAILVVLITMLGPISGAHLNPAVTGLLLRRESPARSVRLCAAQLIAALVGVLAAHAMFDLPLLQVSTKVRAGAAQGFAEWVATFGLIATILADAARQAAGGGNIRRALHHGGLLVHGLDFVCQPGRYGRPRLLGYVRRHSSCRCGNVRRRAARGRCLWLAGLRGVKFASARRCRGIGK